MEDAVSSSVAEQKKWRKVALDDRIAVVQKFLVSAESRSCQPRIVMVWQGPLGSYAGLQQRMLGQDVREGQMLSSDVANVIREIPRPNTSS